MGGPDGLAALMRPTSAGFATSAAKLVRPSGGAPRLRRVGLGPGQAGRLPAGCEAQGAGCLQPRQAGAPPPEGPHTALVDKDSAGTQGAPGGAAWQGGLPGRGGCVAGGAAWQEVLRGQGVLRARGGLAAVEAEESPHRPRSCTPTLPPASRAPSSLGTPPAWAAPAQCMCMHSHCRPARCPQEASGAMSCTARALPSSWEQATCRHNCPPVPPRPVRDRPPAAS
jgi:hypothetical protein